MWSDDRDASPKPTTPVPPEQRTEAHVDQEELIHGAPVDSSDDTPGNATDLTPSPNATPPSTSPDTPGVEAPPAPSPAETRFKKCRFYAEKDNRTYCSNRDVLPYAGKNGFSAEAWCLECTLYKLRRTPKKRSDFYDDYPY